MEEKKKVTLPENAFRELKPGEQYQPLLRPDKVYPEVTVWSVTVGLVMTIIFSAAAAFLGLKVGQVFEAAIPISIIYNSGRPFQRIQAQERPRRECHHTVHRSLLRCNRRRSDLHPPRPVHPAGQIS